MDELQSTADVNYLQKNVFLRRLLLVESHWGRLLLCVEGIFWLIWLFQHVMNVSIVLPIWWNYILRISSVISITGTFLYIYIAVYLLWNKGKNVLFCIRIIALICMMIAFCAKTWIGWSAFFLTIFISVLIAFLYFNNYIDMAKTDAISSEAVFCMKIYRDDRKYMPILLESINNKDLKYRIANEVGTYIYNAYKYKRRFYFFTFLSISFPAAIAALNSIDLIKADTVNVTISLLSMATVIVTGIMSTMKAKESWVRNREYAELAKGEILKCVMKMGAYKEKDDSERERYLAVELEKIYMEENGHWKSLRSSLDEGSGTRAV